jgi:hypothetical protein
MRAPLPQVISAIIRTLDAWDKSPVCLILRPKLNQTKPCCARLRIPTTLLHGADCELCHCAPHVPRTARGRLFYIPGQKSGHFIDGCTDLELSLLLLQDLLDLGFTAGTLALCSYGHCSS